MKKSLLAFMALAFIIASQTTKISEASIIPGNPNLTFSGGTNTTPNTSPNQPGNQQYLPYSPIFEYNYTNPDPQTYSISAIRVYLDGGLFSTLCAPCADTASDHYQIYMGNTTGSHTTSMQLDVYGSPNSGQTKTFSSSTLSFWVTNPPPQQQPTCTLNVSRDTNNGLGVSSYQIGSSSYLYTMYGLPNGTSAVPGDYSYTVPGDQMYTTVASQSDTIQYNGAQYTVDPDPNGDSATCATNTTTSIKARYITRAALQLH
jgi:hypothetical protein